MFYETNGNDLLESSKDLPTKGIFDKVSTTEIKKPEFVDSGKTKTRDSTQESADGNLNSSILSDVPNFYKKNGIIMENSGYFIIPRSVTNDPRYQSARLKYKQVLHILFENVAFEPTSHAIGSEKVEIKVGQYCVTIRKLAEMCNEGVKHREDKISKNGVDRAITYFEKCGFVGQEVRHGKSIITITIPEFYKREKATSGTRSGTKVGQKWDNKEELKEYKEYNISSEKVPFSEFATSLLSEFYSSLFLVLPDFPKDKAKKTKSQYQSAENLLKNYPMELIREVIAYAHKPGGFWIKHVHSVKYLETKFITLKEQLKNPTKRNFETKPSRHNNPEFNKDHRPVLHNNKISFNTPEYNNKVGAYR